MIAAVRAYLASGGADYLASPDYERRRLALAAKLKAGPVSFAAMADTLGMPLAVVVEMYNTWRAEHDTVNAVKH